MFVDDLMADMLEADRVISRCLCCSLCRGEYLRLRGLFRGEFFVLTLFAMLGMMMMISAHHFLPLYLGLELMMLSLVCHGRAAARLARGDRSRNEVFRARRAASGMLLYGMSMIYGATGTLEIAEVAQRRSRPESTPAISTVLVFGLVFIVAGLAFKLGVVPFHMWVPDVYHGAPTAVTLFVSTAPKIAGVRVFHALARPGARQPLLAEWQQMLIVMAVLSIAIGNITAIAQTNLKRMLAYSTISHMGFVLLGILAGNENGFSAAMFYVVVYVLMSSARSA